MNHRRVIIWRPTDRACVDCGRPTRFGRTDSDSDKYMRCLSCETAFRLRGWRYTGTYSSARRKA